MFDDLKYLSVTNMLCRRCFSLVYAWVYAWVVCLERFWFVHTYRTSCMCVHTYIHTYTHWGDTVTVIRPSQASAHSYNVTWSFTFYMTVAHLAQNLCRPCPLSMHSAGGVWEGGAARGRHSASWLWFVLLLLRNQALQWHVGLLRNSDGCTSNADSLCMH